MTTSSVVEQENGEGRQMPLQQGFVGAGVGVDSKLRLSAGVVSDIGVASPHELISLRRRVEHVICMIEVGFMYGTGR